MTINIEVWVKIIFNYLFDQKFWAFFIVWRRQLCCLCSSLLPTAAILLSFETAVPHSYRLTWSGNQRLTYFKVGFCVSTRFPRKNCVLEISSANITLQRGVIWDFAQSARKNLKSKIDQIFPCALKAKSQITPLCRVMFAINTTTTSRRVCFNPKRTVFPCALG